MIPGETVATGALTTCLDCGEELKPKVCRSGAGYYVGYWCQQDGPHSRESGYYASSEAATLALKEGRYGR